MKEKKNNRFYFPIGQKCYPKRELKIDNTGRHYIGYVIDSETNKPVMDSWYEDIQKAERSCDIRVLFENAVKNDNMDLLKVRQKVSADVSEMANNLLDLLNNMKSIENYFNSLPVEIKKDFNNNYLEFIKRNGQFSQSFIENSKAKKDLLNLQLEKQKQVQNHDDGKEGV